MQTIYRLRSRKGPLTLGMLAAITLVALALPTGALAATLTFTEHNAYSLTASWSDTYAAPTVTNIGRDQWTVTVPEGGDFITQYAGTCCYGQWLEPNFNTGYTWNDVTWNTAGTFYISSDVGDQGHTQLSDGGIIYAYHTSGGQFVGLQFVDRADVPEPATLSLLAAGLAGLGLCFKKRVL